MKPENIEEVLDTITRSVHGKLNWITVNFDEHNMVFLHVRISIE